MANPAATARASAQSKWPGATVAQRTRNGILHQHPSNPNRYMLDTGLGPLHQLDGVTEIDTDWVTSLTQPWLWEMANGDWQAYAMPGTTDFDAGQIIRYQNKSTGLGITFQPQQIQWTNDLSQIEAVADPAQVPGTVQDGDVLRWSDAFGPGRHFEWRAQSARMQKRVILDAMPPAPSQFILDGGNPRLRLQFIFQVDSGLEIWVNGARWNRAPNSSRSSTATVEFRDAGTGQAAFYIPAPKAWDSNPEPVGALAIANQTHVFRQSGQNLFMEIHIPWSWLQTAVYPVVIDPTIDPIVAASADDAWGRADDATFDSADTSTFCTSHTGASFDRHGGQRFTMTGPANGDTIDVAYMTVQFTTTSVDSINADLMAIDTDDDVDFSTSATAETRTPDTTATVFWSGTDLGAGADVNSPSIVTVVQEIIDRGGWSSGNHITIMARGRSDTVVSTAWTSYDGSSSVCPRLHIEYTVAGVAGQPMMARGHNVPGMRQVRPGRRGF